MNNQDKNNIEDLREEFRKEYYQTPKLSYEETDGTTRADINLIADWWLNKMKEQEVKVRERIIEELAELEHEQWIEWSKNISKTEGAISLERLGRWQKLWRPYAELTDEEKEQDRKWARKVIEIIKGRVEVIK